MPKLLDERDLRYRALLEHKTSQVRQLQAKVAGLKYDLATARLTILKAEEHALALEEQMYDANETWRELKGDS